MDSMDESRLEPNATVTLANKLLRQCHSWLRVKTKEDIGASILIDLYSGFLAERPLGIIANPLTQEDEVHNCQTVIDQLATNLHSSLSHIRGRSIVEGDAIAIHNLLEIISMLADIILNKIDSDISTDFDDTRQSANLPSQEVADELSSRDLRWDPPSRKEELHKIASRARTTMDKSYTAIVESVSHDPKEVFNSELANEGSRVLYEKTSSLIERANNLLRNTHELKDTYMPSSSKQQPSRRPLENNWVASDHIGRGQAVLAGVNNNSIVPSTNEIQPSKFSHLGDRPKKNEEEMSIKDLTSGRAPHRTITHHLYHHYPSHRTDLSATTPIPRRFPSSDKDQFRSTIGVAPYGDIQPKKPSVSAPSKTVGTKSSQPLTAKGLASSYNDLHGLVSQTAAYVRAAVKTSPARSKLDRNANYWSDSDEVPARRNVDRISDRRIVESDRADQHLARDLNKGSSSSKMRQPTDLTLSSVDDTSIEVGKKVSFHDEKKYGSSVDPEIYRDRLASDEVATIRVDIQRKSRRKPGSQTSMGGEYGSVSDVGYLSDNELDIDRRKDGLRKRYHEVIAEIFGDGDLNKSCSGRPVRRIGKQKKKPNVLNIPKRNFKFDGPLSEMRHKMMKENNVEKSKTRIIKDLYGEDLEDLYEEYRGEKLKNKKSDKMYKRKLLKGQRSGSLVKECEAFMQMPGQKKKRKAQFVATKLKKRTRDATHKTNLPAKAKKDDGSLMSVLLEQFPHLYLSDHTWHELWRKGINNIEHVTRPYEENKRKQSTARQKVEAAAKMHDQFVDNVKKQLDHAQRLKEIRTRKAEQIVLHNKKYDKRLQSVRVKNYYNEYQVKMRSKMLQRRGKEESIFRRVFEECLTMQKERVHELRKYTREQRAEQALQRNNEILSLENYYKDQFSMLAERVERERDNLSTREDAQQKIMNAMRRELRSRMESDIKKYQEQMLRDEDSNYFREIDADRVLHNMHLQSNFETCV